MSVGGIRISDEKRSDVNDDKDVLLIDDIFSSSLLIIPILLLSLLVSISLPLPLPPLVAAQSPLVVAQSPLPSSLAITLPPP